MLKKIILITTSILLLFVLSCENDNKKSTTVKKSGFDSAQEIFNNPTVKDALDNANIQVYLDDDPPNIEGDYKTHECNCYNASSVYSHQIGKHLASALTFYNQTNEGTINTSEEFDFGGSASGYGSFISGKGKRYFTVWQEANNSYGQTVILIISGEKGDDELDIKGLSIVTNSANSEEIGEWWAYKGPLKKEGGSYLEITSPDSYSEWQTNNTYTIKWDSDAAGNVKIELRYSNGNIAEEISESTENDGSFIWTISGSTDPSDYYKIRIKSIETSSIQDESDFFSIVKGADPGGETSEEGDWYEYMPNTGYYSNAAIKLRLTKFSASDFSLSYPLKITKIEHTFYWSSDDPWDENYVYFVLCKNMDDFTEYSEVEYLHKSTLKNVYKNSGKNTYVYELPEPIYVYDDFLAGIKLRYSDSKFPSSLYGKGSGDDSHSYFISVVSDDLYPNYDREYCTRIYVEE